MLFSFDSLSFDYHTPLVSTEYTQQACKVYSGYLTNSKDERLGTVDGREQLAMLNTEFWVGRDASCILDMIAKPCDEKISGHPSYKENHDSGH